MKTAYFAFIVKIKFGYTKFAVSDKPRGASPIVVIRSKMPPFCLPCAKISLVP